MKGIVSFFLIGCITVVNAQTITLASLLEEMSSRETLAKFPYPAYESLQASSYNRESTQRDAPGWFADSDGIGFIREETKNGATEWVVMEHDGPGAITKMWAPYFHWGGLDDLEGPDINIYLDGADKPAISENFFRFIMGRGSVPPPFAEKTARAGNSYLPIPFAKSCKVTFNRKSFYHIINYRGYPKGTKIVSFAQQQLLDAMPLLEQTTTLLKKVYPTGYTNQQETNGELLPGKALALSTNKDGAINSIEILLDPQQLKQHPELLRSVVLEASFDGNQTIWTPLGDFFGSANALNPFQTVTRTVRSNGQMICTWLMPFRSNATIQIKNLSKTQVTIKRLAITTTPHQWDDRSMYFHASWRSDEVLPGHIFKDWNFIDIKGKGVFVGDTWTVVSTDNGWWGEGDEKIYVDDAWDKKFPTHFGTGSEDYYGWAGGEGPSKDDRFSTPFLANIEIGASVRSRQGVRGINVLTRIRFLDAIPFHKRLVFDMEASPGTGARNPWDLIGYSAVSCWYALPGAEDNRPPLPEQAAKPIMVLHELDSVAALIKHKETAIQGAIDVQQLKQSFSSTTISTYVETVSTYKPAGWNHADHHIVIGNKAGDWISYTLTEQFKKSALALQFTKEASYGTVQVFVNGKQQGSLVNLADTKSTQPYIVALGTHTPVNNQFVIKIQFSDSGKKNKNTFKAGVDYVKVITVE
ncbi:MAG: DUF2961 domain-containing protein [Chitinophagaceae bacterium]|nr:DUF2961 domain-containing protein [Chitinophagaceae bacterium]